MYFDIITDGKTPPVHYHKASGHLIFDVRMMLELKAIQAKDGNKPPQPECLTFASVVSIESIRVSITYDALNDLTAFGADIKNAYLQAQPS